MSVFCRHNRFTADCPICSEATVPGKGGRPAKRAPRSGGAAAAAKPGAAPFSGPHVKAGPYEEPGGARYEVRLERVPGGVRLAEWEGERLRRRAPVLPAADLGGLAAAAEQVLTARDADALSGALTATSQPEPDVAGAAPSAPSSLGEGVSRGRSGDFREELRVEPLADGRVRIARWVLRPGAGWELQDAPPMLPADRYAEALAAAVRNGPARQASGAGGGARL